MYIQPLPFDGPATGMTQYYSVWGVNASMTESIKENPWIEQYQVKEDQSGLVATSLVEGEEPFPVDLTWNKMTTITHPSLGSQVDIMAHLVGPNTVQIVYMVKEEGITDINTLRFTEAGIEVKHTVFLTSFQRFINLSD